MARRVFAVALIWCMGSVSPAWAQELTLARMNHASWTARDGAPQGVRVLAQARDGTLWIGTEGGLFHFDGRSFSAFQPPVQAGNMDGEWSVCGSARGEIFVAGTSGDELFSVVRGVVRPLPELREILGVFCGKDGTTRVMEPSRLWEVHAGGLKPIPSIPGLPPYLLRRIEAMPDGTLYAVVAGDLATFGGIWYYTNDRWTKLAAEGVFQSAGRTYVDSRSRLWMGYSSGRIGLPVERRVLWSGTPGLGIAFTFLESTHGFFAAGTNGLAVLRDTSFQMLSFADQASARGVAWPAWSSRATATCTSMPFRESSGCPRRSSGPASPIRDMR